MAQQFLCYGICRFEITNFPKKYLNPNSHMLQYICINLITSITGISTWCWGTLRHSIQLLNVGTVSADKWDFLECLHLMLGGDIPFKQTCF